MDTHLQRPGSHFSDHAANIEDTLHKYRRKISGEEINAMPSQQYEGEIVLVNNSDILEKAVQALERESLLGFDTETRPVFRRGKTHLPSVLQLAGAEAVYVFQLSEAPLNARLASVLSNACIVKAGVAVHDDIRGLRKLYEFKPAAVLDLSDVARHNQLETRGLRNMAANFFGVRIPKGARCSNWSANVLCRKQLLYAATDAWIGREIYLCMKSKGFDFPSV